MTPAVVVIDLGPGVRAGFTTTATGNLGLAVGDDPVLVERRRAEVDAWLGARTAYLRQVHGARVHHRTSPVDEPLVEADAVVSAGHAALGVLVADCVPVLLADPVHRVAAAVHAGRRGVLAGVVPAAVAAMVDEGARPQDIRAVIGPAICGACYEVPAELRDAVADVVPGAAATTSWGTPSLDLPGAVRRQLLVVGVRATDLKACTRTDDRWFSHRASGTRDAAPNLARPAGRFAAVVRLVPGVSPRSASTAGLA
ncbi:MAG TPA: polyphenol oxidase family protein [Actinotalea sp.]|nr:polyphenol oxidase family protein [Actinotalea sp.]